MAAISLRKVQRALRQRGPAGSLVVRDYAHDGVAHMKIPFLPPIYYLLKPEDVHELLVKHGDEAEKLELTARIARSTFGNGILFSGGALWKRQRKLMQPVFHHAHVKAYGERMVAIAEKHVANWRDGAVLDLAQEMHNITLRIVVDTLFSSDASDEMNEVSAAIHDIGTGFAAQAASPLLALMPDWFPAPALRQKTRGAKTFRRVIERLIAERRALGEANSPPDLLSALLYSRDAETGETMDDEQLRGELLTLYVAGHETTAWLLAWALAFLAQHPEAADRLRAELEPLAGKPPTVDDLARLPYSKMVLQETLRLRPPVWFIQRQAHEAITINGRSYPKNAIFMIMVYANHRLPDIFPEPEAFQPERWANDAEKELPKGAYLPFASGQRICIGNGFAIMEAQLLLNLFMGRFNITLLEEPQMPTGTPIILGFRQPVRMRVEPAGS
jgi:cytochrome P450